MNWRDHATPEELARIEELKERRQDASAEIRQIYERCRKRMQRTKSESENQGKNHAKNG